MSQEKAKQTTKLTANSSSGSEDLDITTVNDSDQDFFDAETTPNNSVTGSDISTSKNKCPCAKSDKNSTYVICAKCEQGWHNRCCNLSGLTQHAIKKLEEWQCPRCYVNPIMPKVTAILMSDLRTLKEQTSGLNRSNEALVTNYSSISREMTLLREQLAELTKSTERKPNPLPQNLETILQNAAVLPSPVVTTIEKNLVELTKQVSSLETTVSTRNQASPPHQPIRSYGHSAQSTPMEANTQSPHLKKIITPCSPYVKYEPDAVPSDLKDELLEFVKANESSFKSVGEDSRQVLYYGEHSYRYTGHEHPAHDMPPVLNKLLETIKPKLPSENCVNINSCLVSRYQSGSNHIPLHRDDEPVIDPESLILTVSLGAQRKMRFENNDESQTDDLCLDDSSLLISSRFAQDFWRHGILNFDPKL